MTLAIAIWAVTCPAARAQINTWTYPDGGYWDDFRNWSLGVRPASPQFVSITNAPTKLVTIDSYTSGTYPESLTITSLTLSADAGLTNTLFLSNAGTGIPLYIQDSLVILRGGALLMTNSSLQVGGPAGGSFILEGTASISGTNSFSGGVYIGLSTNSAGSISMADGQAMFTNGYIVIGFYGSGRVSLPHGTLQAGDDISLPNGVFLGLTSGSQGTLSIGGGTYLAPEHLCLGQDTGSTGVVWVTGGQLILTNNYLTTIGGDGVGQLTLSNAQLAASSMIVATGPGSLGTLTVAGSTATLLGGLVVGDGLSATGTVSITGGQLTVTNQNMVVGSYGVGQLTMSNGTLLAQNLNVGNCTGSVGLLTIAGGTVSVASNLIAGVFTNATGVIQVNGGNLTVTNQSGTAQLVVGQFGTGFLVQNGGVLAIDQFSIASASTSNRFFNGSNIVVIAAGSGQVVLSNGLLLAQTVKLGLATNAQGSLTIAGGTASVASNLVAGVLTNAMGVIQVTGGSLSVTNQSGTAQLVAGMAGHGTFTQSGGVVTVDQLLVTNGTYDISTSNVQSVQPQWSQIITNGPYSTFSFSSGVFNTKSTTVSNTQTFVVGDGGGAATYHLLGGIHSFANGLLIRNHSVLSGCGTIIGSVVVDAGGTVLADCGGALTFTGIVTNNGVLRAVSGSTLESYGPVVNNGVIDILAGNTNFHSGFINNGVVLNSDSIPRFISVATVGSDVRVRFTTALNATYVFEYTGDLVTGSWIPLVGFTGPGDDVIVTDPAAALQTQRFYRVRLVVPP